MQSRFDDTISFTSPQGVPSLCRLRIFEDVALPAVVIATELSNNPGTSVTNAVETIASLARARTQQPENGFRLIEHYEQDGSEPYAQERFAEVTFSTFIGTQFRDSTWRHIAKEDVETLVG